MIHYLRHAEIDKSRWDNCVASSQNELVYAYSWYLDCVCTGWDALVLGNYEAVMPLTYGKKYSLTYLYQPFFCQQLGIFSPEPITDRLLQSFLKSVPKKYVAVDICLNPSCHTDLVRPNYELLLKNPANVLFKHYSGNHKRTIKKAEKENLHENKRLNMKQLINLYKEYVAAKTPEVKDRHYTILEKLAAQLQQLSKLELCSIQTSTGELCAGAAFVRHYNRHIFLFSASSPQARQNGAMHLLIHRYIVEHAGENGVLDFEGSSVPSLARFYSGFGAEKRIYYRFQRNFLPFLKVS